MKHFKLKQGVAKVYYIDKETFEELTQNKPPYCIKGKDGVERRFAICPVCDNPIQIVGMYVKKSTGRKIDPYGKHYNNDAEIAKHNEYRYKYCPYASNTYGFKEKALKREETEYEKNIYNIVRDYFDLAAFIFSDVTGILVGKDLAKILLENYRGDSFHMYYMADIYNIPWMIAYAGPAIQCNGLWIKKNSIIYNMINELDGICLENIRDDIYRIKRSSKWNDLSFKLLNHKREVVGNELKESICFCLSAMDDNGDIVNLGKKELCINVFRFPNLIVSKKAVRKDWMTEMAREVLK